MGQCQSASMNLSINAASRKCSTAARKNDVHSFSEMFTCPASETETILLDTPSTSRKDDMTMDEKTTQKNQTPSSTRRIIWSKTTTITRIRYVGGRPIETTKSVVEEGAAINPTKTVEEMKEKNKEDGPSTKTTKKQRLQMSNIRRMSAPLRTSDSCPLIRCCWTNPRNDDLLKSSANSKSEPLVMRAVHEDDEFWKEDSSWFFSAFDDYDGNQPEEETKEEEVGTGLFDDSFWTQDTGEDEEESEEF